MADEEDGVGIAWRHRSPATACPRDRDSWSARRAAAGPARRTAPRRARRACASRRRRTSRAAAAPPRRSRGRRGWWRRAPRPNGHRCRRGASGSRRCGAGRAPSRPRRAARSRSWSAASTTSIRLSGPPGASCATWPMRALRGRPIDAALRPDLAGDQAEEGGLAGAVAPDQAGLGAVRQRHGGVVDQQAMADPVGEVVDVKHGRGFVPRSGRSGKGRGGCRSPVHRGVPGRLEVSVKYTAPGGADDAGATFASSSARKRETDP